MTVRPAKLGDRLTPREESVCSLLVAGASRKEAARKLGISHRTVESHVEHIFCKIGVNSVVKLTRVVLLRELGKEDHV